MVGLTGGVASGKSHVAAVFKKLGAHLIDADEIAREVVNPGEPAHGEIVEEFGEGVLNEDGTIDRKGLGAMVFGDPGAREKLNAITHPRIMDEIEKRTECLRKGHPDGIVIVDAPLLIEVGLHRKMDKVVVVHTDDETLVKRLMKRDGLTEDEARARLAAQMPVSEKVRYADFVIDSTGSKEDTVKKAEEVYRKIEGG